MHLSMLFVMVFATWRWSDWKNWYKYHSTMLFISVGVFLYLYLYRNALLWDLQRHLLNNVFTEMVYAFIVLPLTVLLLLTDYPESLREQVYRIFKFIIISSILEFVYYKLGFITYNHGWNFWLSIGWYCMMYPMLILHFKKPLYAYLVSIVGLFIFLNLFPIKM